MQGHQPHNLRDRLTDWKSGPWLFGGSCSYVTVPGASDKSHGCRTDARCLLGGFCTGIEDQVRDRCGPCSGGGRGRYMKRRHRPGFSRAPSLREGWDQMGSFRTAVGSPIPH